MISLCPFRTFPLARRRPRSVLNPPGGIGLSLIAICTPQHPTSQPFCWRPQQCRRCSRSSRATGVILIYNNICDWCRGGSARPAKLCRKKRKETRHQHDDVDCTAERDRNVSILLAAAGKTTAALSIRPQGTRKETGS